MNNYGGFRNFTLLEGRSFRRPKRVLLVNRNWYYVTLVLIVLGLIAHQPLLIVIGILLLLVLITMDVWANFCLDNVSYQRVLSQQRALFGEEITLSITVENAKLLPLPWLEVEDAIPYSLTVQGQQRLPTNLIGNKMVLECLFSPRWYERVTRRYTIRCHTRGIHTFGPVKLRSGDIFGFISRDTEIDNKQYILVYPLVVPLSRFSLPARHPFGDQRAPRRLLEDPMRVVGVREYAYGDSMRRVNWKATARTLQLQSKVYEASTTYTLALFLNVATRIDKHYGIHPELQELAICVAASVTDWAINEGYAVGLFANTVMTAPDEEPQIELEEESGQTLSEKLDIQMKRRRIRVPASSSNEQRRRIMEVLARIKTYLGTPIEDMLHAERSHLPAGATVVLITTSVTEATLDILKRMRQNGHAVTILFIGDTPPQLKLAGVSIYYIGGEEMWEALAAAYAVPAQEKAVERAPTFSL